MYVPNHKILFLRFMDTIRLDQPTPITTSVEEFMSTTQFPLFFPIMNLIYNVKKKSYTEHSTKTLTGRSAKTARQST